MTPGLHFLCRKKLSDPGDPKEQGEAEADDETRPRRVEFGHDLICQPMPISPYFRLVVGKVSQMCVVLFIKHIQYYNESQTDPTSFGGSLGTSNDFDPIFFSQLPPYLPVYSKKKSQVKSDVIIGHVDVATRFPCATKGQATNYDEADGSSCQHYLGQVSDEHFPPEIIINEFLQMKKPWSWRWCAFRFRWWFFPEFKKLSVIF